MEGYLSSGKEKRKEDVRKSKKAQISIMDSMQKWAFIFKCKIRIQLPRRKASLHTDRSDPSCTCKRRVGKKGKRIQLFSDLAFTFVDLI